LAIELKLLGIAALRKENARLKEIIERAGIAR
jgi:hypothetical protein